MPSGNHGATSQAAGSAPANSSATVGWSCTSPSAPARLAPANVLAPVPDANSEVLLSTSPPGGVWKLLGAPLDAGRSAALPSASTERTRKK